MRGFNNKMLKRDQSRIGALPEAILHYILSMLDMSDVVKLSLLSKRWRYFWMSVPVLCFDHSMWKNKYLDNHGSYYKYDFMEFVDKVLLQHDGSNVIKLDISCSCFCKLDRITTWLNGAASKQFKKIRLELEERELLRIPDLIFSSAVTKFELVVHGDKYLVQLPKSLSSSPHLKTLILDSVNLPQDVSKRRIMLNCPVLEKLILKNCAETRLIILAPLLKHLAIEDIDEVITQLTITAPNLLSLDWTGSWTNTRSLGNFSSLVTANLSFTDGPPDPQDVLKVLESVSSARELQLSDSINCYMKDLPCESITQFPNLSRLIIMSSHDKYAFCFNNILTLLKTAPLIETLVLEAKEVLPSCDQRVFFPFKLHRLKSVEIGELQGDDDVWFLEFLLKNSPVLQNLKIKMCPMDSVKIRFSRKLQSLPRASSTICITIL